MSETIYSLLEQLDTDKAKEMTSRKAEKDGKTVTEFSIDNGATWIHSSKVETLNMRSREYDALNLKDKGFDKLYRFVKADLGEDGVKLCNKIRGRLAAVELTLDMEALYIKMSRKKANQKVYMPDDIIDTVCNNMAKRFNEGSDLMRRIKKDSNNVVVY